MLKDDIMKRALKYAVILSLAISGPAMSAPSFSTATIPVSATVVDSCSVSATALSFGNYNPLSANAVDTSGTVTALCTISTAFAISLNEGLGPGASVSSRKLSLGDGVAIDYAIYSDPSLTTVWGDGTNGTSVQTGVGNGAGQDFSLYGRLPGAQLAAVGVYSDTITVTISY
jgi:spore coat protein U-like protein